MPRITTYWAIEREVMDLLNILKSDDVATAESTFVKSSGLVDSDVDDAAFPKSAVRRHILTAQQLIVLAIIQTEGHPRRRDYMKTTNVAHLAQLPSGIGPIGAIYDDVTGESYTLRSVDDVNRIRRNPISVGGVTPTFRYYALDGTRIFLTNSYAILEYADYNDFAGFSQANIDAAFSTSAVLSFTTILLPDEFAPALVFASVAIAAGKAAGYTDAGSYYGQLFQAAMEIQGVRKVPLDFRAEPDGKGN